MFEYPVSSWRTVWEGLGSVILLEEVGAFQVSKPMPFLVSCLSLSLMVVVSRCELSATAPGPGRPAYLLSGSPP